MNQKMVIHGSHVHADSNEVYEVINPASEEIIASLPRGTAQDVERAVSSSNDAFLNVWREISPSERGLLLNTLADLIENETDKLAELETLNVGKPRKESIGNVKSAVNYFRYYGGAADKLQGDSIPLGRNYIDFTMLDPLGVTAHIVPWNLPLSIACRSLAPALAAGNTAVVKPAALTPLSTLRLAELCLEAGIPDGVVNVVTGYGSEVGAPLVKHPLIRGITFTGAVGTGKNILRMAADGIKTVVAELGGKSPLIVFDDANLDLAVKDALRSSFINAGQVCSASTRLILHSAIREKFLDQLSSEIKTLEIGPGIEDLDLGPLVSKDQLETVTEYVRIGISEGANLICGGKSPENFDKGFFFEPSLFDKVNPGMRIAQEEIFGPVLVSLSFEDEKEALDIANNVSFGLVAGVYTRDIGKALRMARDIQAGQVWINGWFIGGCQAPFGGYKESGLGREKGMAALMNYVEIKNIGIRLDI